MNILTFDIEEWYTRYKRFGKDRSKYAVFDHYLDEILDALDQRGFKGTFFCLGGMADQFPDIVRKIDECGHEIGCHSYGHTWLNKMTREEVLEDTRRAVDALEQCIGKKVVSYRAPAFSIGEQNKWAFEVLAECGIERDASVYPASRDFGGFPHFGHKTPVIISHWGITLKEFPISTTHLMGKEFAYSGGGYFRFFPLWFVRQKMRKADYSMTYFHLLDLLTEEFPVMTRERYEAYFKEPGTLTARYKRYIKSNLGRKGVFDKLMKLIDTKDFVNIEQADKMINWEEVPIVKI